MKKRIKKPNTYTDLADGLRQAKLTRGCLQESELMFRL